LGLKCISLKDVYWWRGSRHWVRRH